MRYLLALLLSALTACGVELTNVPSGTPTVNSKLLGTPGTSAKLYSVSDILALSTNVVGGISVAPGTGITTSTNNGVVTVSLYTAPSATLSNDKGIVEIGTTITSTVLTWVLNAGAITGQSLNNSIGTLAAGLRTYTHSSSYTTDRTYTLTYSDGTTTNTSSSAVAFEYRRYWGNSSSATLNDAAVIALTQEFSTTRVKSAFSLSPSAEYVYYAYPAAWGAASFTVNGLPNTAWTLVARAFVNASGYSATYNIYRSNTVLTGTGFSFTVY